MRIGFDAKKIVTNLTGIGNYSRGVVNALSACPGNESVLFAPRQGKDECLKGLHPSPHVSFVYAPYNSALRQEWWRCRGVIREIRHRQLDIFHGLSNELPYGINRTGCKSVVTIHDLIFLRYPENYDFISRQVLKAKTRYACLHADKIIAISQRTKQDIIDFYHIAEEKIEVVYQGCDTIFRHRVSLEVQQAVQKIYSIPSRYLLCVGTIEKRKNQRSILHAMTELKEDIHLVLVSKATAYQPVIEEEIRTLGLTDRVHILNHVTNRDLPVIYQGSTLFIYLSYFEGFGLPILEALTSGIPVVAANGSCLEETGGPSSRYCEPFDYRQIAACLNELLEHPELTAQMISSGLEYAERFSEQSIAEHLMTVYHQLL